MADTDRRQASAELIEHLNTCWRVQGLHSLGGGSLKKRLAYPLLRLLSPFFRGQEAFNSAVVHYINTSVRPLESTLEAYKDALDEVQRHREALAARERRMEAAMSAMRTEHQELQTSLGVLHQATQHVSQKTTRRAAGTPPAETYDAAPATAPAGSSEVLSHKYVGFEDQFRGSPGEIRARLTDYVPLFTGTSDVLDVGCGRGEFLELLRRHRVAARGIDLNDAMVEVCRAKGLEATRADAVAYLHAQPDGSLGGLFAAQVVEHLEPAYLTHLLEAAFDKLRPGAPIVLETINPACWFAFFESYIRDITHVRALHPDTLKFLLIASGFQHVEIRYRAPYPEHEKLQPVTSAAALDDAVETLNANVEKLNKLLFTYLDYAAVARRA